MNKNDLGHTHANQQISFFCTRQRDGQLFPAFLPYKLMSSCVLKRYNANLCLGKPSSVDGQHMVHLQTEFPCCGDSRQRNYRNPKHSLIIVCIWINIFCKVISEQGKESWGGEEVSSRGNRHKDKREIIHRGR